ncbi:hypothetical protein ABT030_47530 [Streptomyces mirabilis]|uniref:hypothetical protein n=1 Tax=Streptomyces mirabilis TaxID=68239 RepID=UPI00331D9FC6
MPTILTRLDQTDRGHPPVGASTWTPKEREAYANDLDDLDDPRALIALIAVSAASNRQPITITLAR